MKQPELSSARLTIRRYQPEDKDALEEMLGDPEVMRYTGFRKPQDHEKVMELHEKWMIPSDDGMGVFGVFNKDEQMVGWVMLMPGDSGEAELGYMLTRHSWGKGYATEVCSLMLDYGLERLQLHKIIARCDPGNLASHRVLEKVKMACVENSAEVKSYEILQKSF